MERLGRELVEPMIAEAQKCVDDAVVENADLVDAGVIFGTGFAPFRGGPLHYKAAQTPAAPSQPPPLNNTRSKRQTRCNVS